MRKRIPKKRTRSNTPDPYKNMPPEKEKPKPDGGYVEFRFKANCKFKNKKQKELFNSIMDNRITFVRGPAGTAKTFISLYAALETIKNPAFNINQIVLTKPVVEITTSKGLGALPGTIEEKTDVYFSHFYDNLVKLVGSDAVKFLKEKGFIKEVVLNYIRGATIGRYDEHGNPIGSIVLFDESQNCTVSEMKTLISRMGENTKLVIMGDSDQIDLRLYEGESCGLDDAIDRLYGINMINLIEFDENDIVRDPFLIEIMKRYKND
jgi:phosphate starvation-inducible PhoH-like protein